MTDELRPFHKPVRRPAAVLDQLAAGIDPADVSRMASATASALLARVRDNPDPEVVSRLVSFTSAHGIADVAELWSSAPPSSLPGALWRLYLVQLMIHDDAQTAALLFERGRAAGEGIDEVLAGAPLPASPRELVAVIDEILRGVFEGDFAIALDRAASFCRLVSLGAVHLAGSHDIAEPERADAFTKRALRLADIAGELGSAARLWRAGRLV